MSNTQSPPLPHKGVGWPRRTCRMSAGAVYWRRSVPPAVHTALEIGGSRGGVTTARRRAWRLCGQVVSLHAPSQRAQRTCGRARPRPPPRRRHSQARHSLMCTPHGPAREPSPPAWASVWSAVVPARSQEHDLQQCLDPPHTMTSSSSHSSAYARCRGTGTRAQAGPIGSRSSSRPIIIVWIQSYRYF